MLITMDSMTTTQRLLSSLQTHVRACRRCSRAGHLTPGRPVCSGPATARVLVVGQAPSRSDELARALWSGPAGRRLMGWLAWAGLEEQALRRRHYLSAVTRCYPGPSPSGHGDRRPTDHEVRLCRDYLDAELGLLAPCLVIPVGRLAIDWFGGNDRPLSEIIGRAFQVENTWIVPLPHPSGASLWPNHLDNRRRLARALAIIREICHAYHLA